jgi:hypothetical protein
MYVNAKIIPVETVPVMEGEDFKFDIFDTL